MFYITKPIYDKWNEFFKKEHNHTFEGLVYVIEESKPLRPFDPKTDITIPGYRKPFKKIAYHYGTIATLESNCGAAVHGNIASSSKITFDFFEDLCSIVGKTVIIGSCFTSTLSRGCYTTGAGFKPIYSFISNRCNEKMVVLSKEIKEPYLKGDGIYFGEIK